MSLHRFLPARAIAMAMLAALAATACQRESADAAPEAAAAAPDPAASAAPVPPPTPVAGPSTPAAYDCGGTAVTVGFEGDQATAVIDGEAIPLATVPAASGARYQGARADGVPVELWSKGEQLTLMVAGNAYPECRRPASADEATAAATDGDRYRARGNEPFWSIDVEGPTLRWMTPETPEAVVWTDTTRTVRDDGFDLAATRDGAALALSATAALCRDSMSGMPYPDTVTVRLDGADYRGCGGDPRALLVAGEWTVASIDGKAMDEPPPTLRFMADGGAGGFAGCNRWMAAATLTGEGLAFERPATTMMACPGAAMATEQSFLAALSSVSRHDIDEAGRLVLFAGDRAVITATPAAADASSPEG